MEVLHDIISGKIGLFEQGRTVLDKFEIERYGRLYMYRGSFELREFYDTENQAKIYCWVSSIMYGKNWKNGLAGKKIKNLPAWLLFEAKFVSYMGQQLVDRAELVHPNQLETDITKIDEFVHKLIYNS